MVFSLGPFDLCPFSQQVYSRFVTQTAIIPVLGMPSPKAAESRENHSAQKSASPRQALQPQCFTILDTGPSGATEQKPVCEKQAGFLRSGPAWVRSGAQRHPAPSAVGRNPYGAKAGSPRLRFELRRAGGWGH